MFTIKEWELVSILAKGEGSETEFKKSISIEGFAETICAFVNTNGGILLIGVSDDGKIVGIEPKKQKNAIYTALGSITPYPKIEVDEIKLGDKYVVAFKVAKSNKIHSYRNRVYFRVGASNRPLSLEEIIEKPSESLILRFDELPSNAPIEAIDLDLVKDFLDRRERIRGIKIKGTLEENLKLLKIIMEKNGRKTPSNAGLLFFSKNPQKWIPQAKVHLVWFADENGKRCYDSRFFEGPIWRMVDDIEEYFYRNLKRIGGELVGWKRVEVLEYPIRALREAVTNALIHRNNFDPSEVKIFIYPSKIIIRNPGSFPPGVSIENPIHKPRNPLLAQYMYDIGYIEKYGFGIRMMIEECEKHPFAELKFNIRPYTTEVIFIKKVKEKILDELDKKIVKLLEEYGELSSGEIAKIVSKSKPTIIKRLKKLEGLGLIKSKGRGAAKKYVISKM